ncbi:MAG: hypothetical protein AAGH40_03120 [Verrucomicrobiota bacterium]
MTTIISLVAVATLSSGCSNKSHVTPLSIESGGFGLGLFYQSVSRGESYKQTSVEGIGLRLSVDRIALGRIDETRVEVDPTVEESGSFENDSIKVYWGDAALAETTRITGPFAQINEPEEGNL